MASPKDMIDDPEFLAPKEQPREVPRAAPMPVLTASQSDAPWTLTEAFTVMRQALAHHYEDNMPAYLQLQELAIIAENGGGDVRHPNTIMAWRQIIPLLEQALGASLRMH